MDMRRAQLPEALGRLNSGIQLILSGAVGFASSFLHWYAITPHGGNTMYFNAWHGWGIPAGLMFAGAALAGLRHLVQPWQVWAPREARLMVVFGIAAAACTIVFMVTEGAGYGPSYHTGSADGAWVGMVCAVLLALGGSAFSRENTV